MRNGKTIYRYDSRYSHQLQYAWKLTLASGRFLPGQVKIIKFDGPVVKIHLFKYIMSPVLKKFKIFCF